MTTGVDQTTPSVPPSPPSPARRSWLAGHNRLLESALLPIAYAALVALGRRR
jgi:hypothetical protein